jgi:pimeloyl-ACP methyl ester carboxylesterase
VRRFVDALGLDRYVIYPHDYGSQHGFRLAMSAPERVAGLIIQNDDIYEDVPGPKYGWLKEYSTSLRRQAQRRCRPLRRHPCCIFLRAEPWPA